PRMTDLGGLRTLTGKTLERAATAGLLARITAVYPTNLQLSFTLDTNAATLGRVLDEGTTRAVADPTVSRRHPTIPPRVRPPPPHPPAPPGPPPGRPRPEEPQRLLARRARAGHTGGAHLGLDPAPG